MKKAIFTLIALVAVIFTAKANNNEPTDGINNPYPTFEEYTLSYILGEQSFELLKKAKKVYVVEMPADNPRPSSDWAIIGKLPWGKYFVDNGGTYKVSKKGKCRSINYTQYVKKVKSFYDYNGDGKGYCYANNQDGQMVILIYE